MKSTSMKVRLFAASAVLSTLAGTGMMASELKADTSVEPVVATVATSTTAVESVDADIAEAATAEQGVSVAAPATADLSGLISFLQLLNDLIMKPLTTLGSLFGL